MELFINNKLVYLDVADGYSDCIDIKKELINKCDYYFRRSFSTDLNKRVYGIVDKIYPLGLNYFCYSGDSNYKFDNNNVIKNILKKLSGFKDNTYFTYDKFENKANKEIKHPKILFYTLAEPL